MSGDDAGDLRIESDGARRLGGAERHHGLAAGSIFTGAVTTLTAPPRPISPGMRFRRAGLRRRRAGVPTAVRRRFRAPGRRPPGLR